MLGFAIIIFAVAVLFGALALSIYRGNVKLIHDYHYKKVTDVEGYTKAFGKALSPISIGSFLSGAISLFGESDALAFASVGFLVTGIAVSLVLIVIVQKKYNGGMF